MIVVDTNILCYLVISGEMTPIAQNALRKDPLWAAPYLWRTEFCNVLAGYLRKEYLSIDQARNNLEHAHRLLRGREYPVSPQAVLELVASTNCTAYDCEFVALAQDLGVKLVTLDKQILAQFPDTAVELGRYVS